MLNANTVAFVGIAIFAVVSLAPIFVPAAETFIGSLDFAPRY